MNSSKRSKPALLAALLLACTVSQGCSTRRITDFNGSDTPASQPKIELVKRSQTQTEIDELHQRYASADAAQLPSGLKGILRQMVTINDSSPQAVTETAPNSATSALAKDGFVDLSNDYVFGAKKPNLPLRGGFLNNPFTSSTPKADAEQPKARNAQENAPAMISAAAKTAPSEPLAGAREDARGRLLSPEPLKAKLQKGMIRAQETTDVLLQSANESLSSASEAIDQGFASLKQQISNRAAEAPAAETEAVLPAPEKTAMAELDSDAVNPSLKQELSSAKRGFLSRFNRDSYSLLHEGIIIVALTLGFLVVTWIRLEYQAANRRK